MKGSTRTPATDDGAGRDFPCRYPSSADGMVKDAATPEVRSRLAQEGSEVIQHARAGRGPSSATSKNSGQSSLRRTGIRWNDPS